MAERHCEHRKLSRSGLPTCGARDTSRKIRKSTNRVNNETCESCWVPDYLAKHPCRHLLPATVIAEIANGYRIEDVHFICGKQAQELTEEQVQACGFQCPDFVDGSAGDDDIEDKDRDRLLGIYNRGYFDERLRKEFQIAAHMRAPLSLVMLDIDHFKKFNDEHGHQVGDEVLRCVAAIARRTVKQKGILCRYGGEEIAVIMPAYTREEVLPLAERLRREIEEYRFVVGDRRLQLTASVGCGVFGNGITKLEELVGLADRHLYQAKRAGRNRVYG